MPDIGGIPYVESGDLVSAYPTVSQSLAQEVSDQLASKLPYSYGTATPTTTDSGFLWYDSNSTPAAPKFWDGAAFQALTSGKILQVVRATDSTNRSTTSTSFVDAGISVTITPTKSDSVVMLFHVGRLNVGFAVSGSIRLAELQITDASNNPISGAEALELGLEWSYNVAPGLINVGYATPATTSSVTYKARFRVTGSPIPTATLANATNTGQLFAIEVSA